MKYTKKDLEGLVFAVGREKYRVQKSNGEYFLSEIGTSFIFHGYSSGGILKALNSGCWKKVEVEYEIY